MAAECFLDPAASWQDSIADVLAALGNASGVSRVYLFENYRGDDGEIWATQRYEWDAPGIHSQMENPLLLALPYVAAGWGRWAELLGSGELVLGHTRELPESEQPELRAEGIKSIVLVPIFVEQHWWGFIGFDECEAEREWSAGEVGALKASASTLGAALGARRAEEELRAREAEYRALFQATGDGLVVTDLQGRMVEANPAFCMMHGYRPEELIGKPATAWVHPDFHSLREEYTRIVGDGRQFQTQAIDVRKDGSTFPVEIHGTAFTFRGEPHILGVVRDVTERARTQELLEHRAAALARVAKSLTVDQPLQTTLRNLAQTVVDATPAVACSVQIADVDSGDLRIVGSAGLPDGYVEGIEASWRSGVDSPTTRALREQRSVIVRNGPAKALAIPEYAPLHSHLASVEWDTIAVVPLDALGRSIGAMNVYYLPQDEPGDDEIAFLRALAYQGAAAVENARLYQAVHGTAALEERQRLARELHDSVSQALYGIALGARTARTLADRDPAALHEPLDYVLTLAEAGLAEMRALIFELRPESLASEGLVAALDRQARALRARHELDVAIALGDEPDAPLAVKEALYRIAQEAFHNIVKHAGATTVTLHLGDDGGAVALEVVDDGHGFDASGDFPGHLGLRSMTERAEQLGGTLVIDSALGCGTRLRARVPTDAGRSPVTYGNRGTSGPSAR